MSCQHYPGARQCRIISPCCHKIYCCHNGHNEEEPTHQIIRQHITEIICEKCETRQSSSNKCVHCDITFADYYCGSCNTWREEGNYYHCDGCGFCRVGKIDDFEHCDKCNLCFHIETPHINCRKVEDEVCAICLDDNHPLRISRIPIISLPCTHHFHSKCFNEYLKLKKDPRCPICRKDMEGDIFNKSFDFLYEKKEEYRVIFLMMCYFLTFHNEIQRHPDIFTILDLSVFYERERLINDVYFQNPLFQSSLFRKIIWRVDPNYVLSKMNRKDIYEYALEYSRLSDYQHTKCIDLLIQYEINKENPGNKFNCIPDEEVILPETNEPEEEEYYSSTSSNSIDE